MEQIKWDWFNTPNKKEAIKAELKPLIENAINKFGVCEIVTSPEIAVILDETNLLNVVSSEENLTRENGEEFCYVIFDKEFEDDVKCEVYLDRKMPSDTMLFKSTKQTECELKINLK